ncbi:MAG: hypothetical protein P3X22_007495 [Thermoprotei archaeon]|nr:hypothetical protein [Thermoprotei archaeon]
MGFELERGVRRLLRPLKALKPGSRALVPITFFNPIASLGLAIIVSRMKMGYGSVASIAIPEVLALEDPKGLLKGLKTFKVGIEPLPETGDPFAILKLDKLWSLKLAREFNYNVILLPITSTDITVLTLEASLRGDEELWADLAYSDNVNGILIVNALAGVELEAIMAYAALNGLNAFRVGGALKPETVAYKILYALKRGPELEFSSHRVLALFREGALGRLGFKCRVCGSPSREPGYCGVCRYIRAYDLTVTSRNV